MVGLGNAETRIEIEEVLVMQRDQRVIYKRMTVYALVRVTNRNRPLLDREACILCI